MKKEMSCELENIKNDPNNKNYCSEESVIDTSKSTALPKKTAEQESQLYYYRNQVKEGFDDALQHENDPIYLSWKSVKGHIIDKIAKGLAGCIDNNDPELEIKDKHQICTYIVQQLQDKINDYDPWLVYKTLNDDFKNPHYQHKSVESSSDNNLQENRPKTSIISLYEEAKDHETFRKNYKAAKAEIENREFIARENHIALVGHKEEPVSISTPLPDNPHQTETYRTLERLKELLLKCSSATSKVRERSYQFPINDPQVDKETADSINQISYGINALTEFFDDISDLKATHSPVKWLEILSIAEEEGLGKAVNDSKGIDINGQSRKLTKKQIKQSYKKKKEKFDNLITGLGKLGVCFVKLSEWKDLPRTEGGGGVYESILTRKNQLSPILSEGAFGTRKGGDL